MSSLNSDADLKSRRDTLYESWQYIANPEFPTYASWNPINATSNELHDPDGNPATIVIVGQVVTEKLAVDPLGNFQSQEERLVRYQDSVPKGGSRDSISCANAKMIIIVRRPSASLWTSDYKTATARLNILQEEVAKANAPRQHLLDKEQNPPFVRVTFPLWDKKKYTTREQYLDDPVEKEDDIIRSLREEHDFRAKQTVEYGSYLPDNCSEAFRSTAKTHHIRQVPVFLPNGKRVSSNELRIRLEDAVVEVMFSLKHYYYGPSGNKFKQTKVGNTFTATIEQITILQINVVVPSPLREPAMKTIQSTPPSRKGKSSKRASSHTPEESSPAQSKKKKLENLEASSSSSRMSPTEDESIEEITIQKALA